MPTGNHDYIIDIQGENFEAFQLTDVLPGVLVEAHQGGNQLAGSMLLHWLERKPGRKPLFDRITSESKAVVRYTACMRDV